MLWSVGVKTALQEDGQFKDVVLGRKGVAKEFRVPVALRDRLRSDITPDAASNGISTEDVDAAVYAVVDEFGVLTARGQSTSVLVFFVTTPVPAMVLQLLEGTVFMETNADQIIKVDEAGHTGVRGVSDTLHIITTQDLFNTLKAVIRYRYNVDPVQSEEYLHNFAVEIRFESVMQPDAEPFLRTLPTKFYTDLGLDQYDFSGFEQGLYMSPSIELDEMDEAEDDEEEEFDPYDVDTEDLDEDDKEILRDMEQD